MYVKYTPRFFTELLHLLFKKNSYTYNHPFVDSLLVDESRLTTNISIFHIVFFNNKFYGKCKNRKKGVVKRKVLRKIKKNNLLID